MATPNYTALSASNGSGEPVRATVQAGRTVGSTSITVNATTNWPTSFIGTTGTLLSTGKLDSTTEQVFYGTASGTTVTITSFAPGYTDKGNAIGDVVVIKPTTEWANIIGGAFATGIAVPQATTGVAGIVLATGSDTNIDLKLAPKGTGSLLIPTNTIQVGYTPITTTFTGAASTDAQVTGLSSTVTIPVGGRSAEITFYSRSVYPTGGYGAITISIWDGAVGTGTKLQDAVQNIGAGNAVIPVLFSAIQTPSAGSHTYNIGYSISSGSSANISASTTSPAYILIKLI